MSIKRSLKITFLMFAIMPMILLICLSYRSRSEIYIKNMKENSQYEAQFYCNFLSVLKAKYPDMNMEQFIMSLTLDKNQDLTSLLNLKETRHAQILSKQKVLVSTTNDLSTDAFMAPDAKEVIFTHYAQNATEAFGSFTSKYKSKHYVYGYAFFENSNLLFVLAEELKYTTNASYILEYISLFFVILLPWAFLCDIYYKRHYLNPINEIRKVMKTAASGDLDVTSNIKSKNELGDLSRSLNKMLHIIKGNYDELTAMHERILENEDKLQINYAKIKHLAYHDVLTDLPNRLCFLDFADAIIKKSKVSQDHHAFFFIDLDNFKMINDTLGHNYGDLLLKQTAQRLLSLTTESDCVARAGGDEFMIMLPNIDSKSTSILFADQVIEAFKLPFYLDDETAYVSMSIGIAIFPENGLDSTSLIKNADIAMYDSKENGKNKFTSFNHQMEERLNRKNVIIEVLRHAIENKEVYLLYQPQIDLNNEKIVAFEALMRIYNPKLGLLCPKEFIPIAEETGLINELGTWVLKEACAFNKQLIDAGFGPCTVAINISPVQINRFDFYDVLSRTLQQTKLPPEYLELELTESALVSSIAGTATIIRNLKSIGVKAALDDFGTGYSSLSYLAKMNIHTLKIDKSFIDNICLGEKELSMIHTIIRLAHHLGIQVVAEGAEYQAQLELLKSRKCDLVQGFVYSAPISGENLAILLKKGLPQ